MLVFRSSANFTFTAFDKAGNVKLLLQSLAAESKAKILASPHILVSDNREASIQVGSAGSSRNSDNHYTNY